MKKQYNSATTNDMPLDRYSDSIVKVEKTKQQKNKISPIGKNTKEKNSKKSTVKVKLKSTNADLKEIEKINENNLMNFSTRSKRNKVIVIVLSVLLALSIVGFVIYGVLSRLENNCFLTVHGTADAVFVVEGKEIDKLRTPANVTGDRNWEVDILVKIRSAGTYDVKFKIEAYQNGELMTNTLAHNENSALFQYDNDGYYYGIKKIEGEQTIQLCKGVKFDSQYEGSLNVDNLKIKIDIYIE